MNSHESAPIHLQVSRLLKIFSSLSLIFLGVLAVAPARGYFSEWRAAEQRYNELAAQQGVAPTEVQIRQIWNERLGVVDRCTSCHLGMGAAEPIAGDPLFVAHPTTPHEDSEFGCTVCHGGQGRATKREAAHGRVAHWEEPTLERPYFEAGCGRCHTHLPVGSPDGTARGADLFRRYDCGACHRVGKEGRGDGPSLTFIGAKGVPKGWHARHLALQAKAGPGQWSTHYGVLSEAEQDDLGEYLRSLYGAPRLTQGKTLAHQLGCRGCHKISGLGGDLGPDLTKVGSRREHDLDFSNVEGPHTLPNWLKAHFLAPDRVAQGSKMPALDLSDEQAELLTVYMMSLKPLDVPQEYWPKDRLVGLRLGGRDFAGDGKTLFGVFCAACHGPAGEGRRFPNLGVMPAIGNRDFLAVADDRYLRLTIQHGRPGRPMPAWGELEGGLGPEEIDAIVGHLRTLAPGTPEPWSETLPSGVADRGAAIFARNCSGCHGAAGEGTNAPQLSNPALQEAASDEYLARTILRGRSGSGMRHFGVASTSFEVLSVGDAADVVAFIRTLKEAP